MKNIGNFGLFVLAAVVLTSLFVFGVYAAGLTITSFSATGVPGADDFVNINDKAQASCIATDPAGLKEMAIREITPDGANKTAYFQTVTGNPISKTISSSNIDVSGATGQKLAGIYQFYCTATNSKGEKIESAKVSVNFPAECASCPEPSDWSACSLVNGVGTQERSVYGCSGAPEYVCTVSEVEEKPCDLCSSKNLQYCNTTSKCASVGGVWNNTSSTCSQSSAQQNATASPGIIIPVKTATPSPSLSGKPVITSIGMEPSNPIVGDLVDVFCKATDDEGLKEIKLTVVSPTGNVEENINQVNGTSGSAEIKSYNLTEEGKYSIACQATDLAGSLVAASKLVDVGLVKPKPTPEKQGEATILAEEKLTASENITAGGFLELVTSAEVAASSFVELVKIEVSDAVDSTEVSVGIKALSAIPQTDERGQSLTSMPSTEQPVIKVIQFTPTEKLSIALKQATIYFVLTEDELKLNNMTVEDVVLARFSDGLWAELPTNYTGQTEKGHSFKSTSPGFSIFIVTRKLSSIKLPPVPVAKQISNLTCQADSECAWYSSNGCLEESGAIWKCGSTEASSLLTGLETQSCSDFFVPKPKAETCGCVQNKCVPVETAGRETSLLKSGLLDALMTIEQFKIRFDHLSKRSKQISDYYDKPDSASDFTTWSSASSGFSDGAKTLESLRKNIKSIKDNPTQDDLDRITKQLEDVVKILDTSLDFLLKDVLDIGPLGAEETVALAVGQSMKMEIDGEIHTVTVNSIEGDEVEFLVNSTPQTIKIKIGEDKKLALADTATSADTSLAVAKAEKNVVYVRIGSLLAQLKTDIQCTEMKTGDIKLADSEIQTCYNIVGDNLIFDGNGKTLNGGGLGYGIFVSGNGVTVKNVILRNYMSGIKMSQTTGSTVENVQIILNKSGTIGIELTGSSNNRIANNIIEVGKIMPGEITVGGIAILNDVVLQDSIGGSYTPFVSITSLEDESKYLDSTGTNPLEAIKFEITVTPKGKDSRNRAGKVELDMRKGQTKFEKVDAVVYPDGDEAEVQVIIRALGKSLEFTKKINMNVPFAED